METIASIRSKKVAAFTLVEVMVSSLIGTIIFTALFYGISQGTYIAQVDRENLRATEIMVGKLEGIRLCAWGDTTNATQLFSSTLIPSTFVDHFYPATLGGGVATDSVPYYGTITIQTNGATGANNFAFYGVTSNEVSPPSYSNQMALVTVTLTWSDVHYGRTNAFNRTMKAYISQNGVQNYVFNN